VTWSGTNPARTTCGGARIGVNRGVGGVVIYVEKFPLARAQPMFGRSVGGTVAKHGCTLVPAAQIVTLPGGITIHGDAQPAAVKVSPPSGAPQTLELQEAGLAEIDLEPGVTRVEGNDGKLSAAWVFALETPFYAITDDAGRFRIDELVPGTYDVTIWQAPNPTIDPGGRLVYGAPTIMHRSIAVDGRKPALLNVVLGR
jgi:hypothetical protein